jgi:DNA-binding GntR family transcriptional regulator
VVDRGVELVDRLRRHVTALTRNGQPVPGEHAIAERFGSSRPAVREALVALEREGLLRRHRGSGIAVNPLAAELVCRFDQQHDFVEVLRQLGYVPQVEVIEADWTSIDAATAERLRAPVGSPAFRTVKRWLADDLVAMVATDTILVAEHPSEPVAEHSLFDLVEELTCDVVEWEVAWPSAENLCGLDAERFALPAGHAVLVLDLVGVGRQGDVRYHARELHRPGLVPAAMVRSVRH